MKRIFAFIARAVRLCLRPVYKALKRLRLRNHGFSLITSNCCGGVIYHDLGQQFRSPTINLSIPPDEYIVFLEHLSEALSVDPQDAGVSGSGYPLGDLRFGDGQTVRIHFVHYRTFEEALDKWKERCARVDFDNLFVLLEAGNLVGPDVIRRFDDLDFKNKMLITAPENRGLYRNATAVDVYGKSYYPGKILEFRDTGLHPGRYLDAFDYVKWLNHPRKGAEK